MPKYAAPGGIGTASDLNMLLVNGKPSLSSGQVARQHSLSGHKHSRWSSRTISLAAIHYIYKHLYLRLIAKS